MVRKTLAVLVVVGLLFSSAAFAAPSASVSGSVSVQKWMPNG